jgi:large subunit ribosomal protein L4e
LKSNTILGIDGRESNSIALPEIFETPYRPEVIHKVYVNLLSHTYQRQGRYPAAGEIVSAESRNTGLGIARLARARGEGFPRAGQAAGVAGVRHGRVAHPPESWKEIYKKINKKEKQLGLCSAIAATGQKDLIIKRGHKIGKLIVVENDENLERLSGSIPGVEVKSVERLSVLDLAPGAKPIRLTIFSQNAIEKLKDVKAPIVKVMEMMMISK